MKKTLIVVNGYPRSGKDTFMDYCVGLLNKKDPFRSFKHSTVDTCKRIAKEMGWDGEKTPEMRRMLSELKDLYTKYFDGPLKEVQTLMNNSVSSFIFVAAREPKEILRMEYWCSKKDYNCITVLVKSTLGEDQHSSHSDSNVLYYKYDVVLENNGSLEEFLIKSKEFVDNHLSV